MVRRNYKRLLILSVLLIAISGCSTRPERIVTVTETVKEPVPVFQEINIPTKIVQKVEIEPVEFSKIDDSKLAISKSDAQHLLNVINELVKKHKALREFNRALTGSED